MQPPRILLDVLADQRLARPVSANIWSVMPAERASQPYDGRAKLYDRLIGSRLYNRLAWGVDPARYQAFAHTAQTWGTGPLLDAGCGTLVSTAPVYAGSNRPTILVDLSIDMLKAARDRLLTLAPSRPETLVLLQADILDLPFRNCAFGAVLCPGMLHLFEDLEATSRELARVSEPTARIFATSLVAERWIGRHYLTMLHQTGEVARPRTATELKTRLNGQASGLARPVDATIIGSMAFVTARPG